MYSTTSLTLSTLALLPSLSSAETVLATYIFHRHGDRTAKMTPPANLTALGYNEVFTAGTWFRGNYIAADAPSKIYGLSSDQVNLAQLAITAPVDNVLMSSATGFSQALYPGLATTNSGDGPGGTETLRNGTAVEAPLNGYQIIPIGSASTGSGSEDSGWLQASTDCGAAETSSNEYFSTPEYKTLLQSTQAFYTRIAPTVNQTFSSSQTSYKNAYTIFDLLNVAEIHNASIQSSDLLDASTLFQLRTLADTHELNLAYNASSTVRAVAGMQLAAQIVDFLNSSATKASNPKLGVQFGNYATMQSIFGLSDLLSVPGAQGTNDSFHGVPDYASALVWELYTPSNGSVTFPVNPADLNVRFLFHNGTTSNSSTPNAYPLFNSTDGEAGMSWEAFAGNMSQIAVGTTQEWCQICGNSTGTCAPYATNGGQSGGDGVSQGSTRGSHLSNAVAGVIGAMVTLGVILLVEAAVLVVGGLRLVSKKRLAGAPSVGGNGVANGAGKAS